MINDLIGAEYKLGGRDADTGIDCWGVVLEVYERIGRKVPDYWSGSLSRAQLVKLIREEREVFAEEVEKPDLYDLVVDYHKGHIGVWIDGKVLHASKEYGVKMEPFFNFKQLYPHTRFFKCQ